MAKTELIKKEYSKPEIEFVAFNYREIVSASEITDVDDDEEGIGGDDMDSVSMPKLSLGFFGLGGSSGGDISTGDTEEYDNTSDGGLGLFDSSNDDTSNDTSDDSSYDSFDSGDVGGGLFDSSDSSDDSSSGGLSEAISEVFSGGSDGGGDSFDSSSDSGSSDSGSDAGSDSGDSEIGF